jgi:glycosyltransferase involved in cell wall biosynthesis
MESKVKFSVVIPTRNRENSLRNLVNKINQQTLLPDEIIIVDSSEKKQLSYYAINKSINYFNTLLSISRAFNLIMGKYYFSISIFLSIFILNNCFFVH